ncbi:hypothetical protein DM01DRAFT_1365466 [Hesseltinella vesiculosa]|uniref:Ricin B lectin domain-containing protein n=1 Tax=Hesseltinella vesiculosa TaxID=101127 RepID=A0A1X2GVY2_9FUNG|nr:hypothetical protein DM01DRAFT_1365466 [Hesseltinella vesiculosa]
MTADTFPIGYFYIVSRLNGLVLDIAQLEHEQKPVILTAEKKTNHAERDTQLFIEKEGFLTNKSSGYVLDVDKAGTFKAIFTGEQRLFLDHMKEEDEAHDQRFGYDGKCIFTLSNPDIVLDIRKAEKEAGARVMVYDRKKDEEAPNQMWEFELADPPKVVAENPEDDNSKHERIQAWFGNWFGWGDKKKVLLDEKELTDAHTKIYKEKKSHASHQLLAGAVAYEAVKIWEKQQEAKGEKVNHSTMKKMVAGIAAAELVKLVEERRGQDDDENDDEEKKKEKKGIIEGMATKAAMNLIESKYGIKE